MGHILILDFARKNMTYPQNIEQKIDFQVIRDCLKSCCTSSLGKERVDEMLWVNHYKTVQNRLAHLREMMYVLTDSSLSFPQGDIYDLREALARIRVEGLFMDENELFSLRKMLDYVGQLDRFFTLLDREKYPLLASLPLTSFPSHLIVAIDRIIDR